MAIAAYRPYILKVRMKCDLEPLNRVLRMNKYDRHAYYNRLYQDVGLITTGHRPESALKKARLILRRNANRMYDYDGLVAAFKPVVDALEHVNILKNDSWYTTGPWDVSQSVSSKGNESIYIEVQEV